MCIALLEHHCGKHFPGIASALINKALVLMQQGNDIDAITSLKKALRIHESICGKLRLQQKKTQHTLIFSLYCRWRLAAAQRDLSQPWSLLC
jgi:tetratricopeptide (TPR) repeat protein